MTYDVTTKDDKAQDMATYLVTWHDNMDMHDDVRAI